MILTTSTHAHVIYLSPSTWMDQKAASEILVINWLITIIFRCPEPSTVHSLNVLTPVNHLI